MSFMIEYLHCVGRIKINVIYYLSFSFYFAIYTQSFNCYLFTVSSKMRGLQMTLQIISWFTGNDRDCGRKSSLCARS